MHAITHRSSVHRTMLVAAITAVWAVVASLFVLPGAHAATTMTSVTVDGTRPGLVFDGIGAISGGGGNSRLLIDYPEPQRSELLDYLFKPGYGASLQILKLEIGGDTNSTDGAEPSHEHTQGVVDCNQGYEWWLAGQAKLRNPNIKLSALTWGAPGWVGGGNFWSTDTINYLTDWLGCAKQHNLTIDYLGGWNERGYDKTWYENLKSTLVAKGYGAIKVVAADSTWDVADAMVADPAFNNAVDVVGVHYPCTYGSSFTSCPSTANAVSLGKPLWASENGSEAADGGAPSVARALNRDYIDGKMTSYINWPVIAALYPNLQYSDQGMSIADQPWSGNYHIGTTTWVTAQTTQFTQPGWHYIDAATGYLGGDRNNGSYSTLKSTNNSDYSTIVETMDATTAQTLNLAVTGGLSTGTVHVWATKVKSVNSADYFVHTQDITPVGGAYSVTLQPGYVYTLTTTTGQGKGTAVSPAPSAMPLPYADNFDSAAASTSPKYFSDMNGAFQTVACGGGRSGNCLRQMAPTKPIQWTDENYYAPYTIIGDGSWSNYTVTADTLFEQAGSVEVLGRVGQQGHNNNGLNAYHLVVDSSGAWSIKKSASVSNAWQFTTLASGTVSSMGLNTWHTVSLKMLNSTLTASLDNTVLGSVVDSSYTSGLAGLGVVGSVDANGIPTSNPYLTQEFDNFALTPSTADAAPHVGPITSGVAGKCVDDFGSSSTPGAAVGIYDCNGTPAQKWTVAADGSLQINGLCMDVTNATAAKNTPVELWNCNGGSNQKWIPQADGTLRSGMTATPNLCLDDPGANTANGTQLIVWDCNGGTNQKWTLP